MLAENISNWKVYLKYQETDLKYQSDDKREILPNRAVILLITTAAHVCLTAGTALQSLYFLTFSFRLSLKIVSKLKAKLI